MYTKILGCTGDASVLFKNMQIISLNLPLVFALRAFSGNLCSMSIIFSNVITQTQNE